MRVGELMTSDIVKVTPGTPVGEIAALMRSRGVGVIPVCENGKVVGIVTDRDIVIRFLPGNPDIGAKPARDIMSRDVIWCHEDQQVSEMVGIMGDHQVRRLPVLDRTGALVGMVSVSDVAENASEHMAGETLGEIVEKHPPVGLSRIKRR